MQNSVINVMRLQILGQRRYDCPRWGCDFRQAYDEMGNMVVNLDPNGEFHDLFVAANEYDAAGCLSSVTNALGLSVETLHDAVGRVVCTILPDGSSVSNDYDRSESPVATTLPHGETHEFGWTPVGLPSSYTAPEAADAGRRLDKTYDAAREQVELVKPDGTVKLWYN